jgi:hypothetical protein
MHDTEGDENLFHRYSSMLEGILVKVHKLVVVVGVYKKVTVLSEHVGCTYVDFWKENIGRVAHFENLLWIVVKVFSCFVAKIAVGIAIAYNLDGIFYANGSVVGRNDECAVVF